jgi:hypothetical protein
MKVLYIYCNEFGYKPTIKTLEQFPDYKETETKTFYDVQVAFIHAEEKDMQAEYDLFKKLVNNIKWICRKNNTKKIILHSFAHLSESKASSEFTFDLFNRLENRLKSSNYEVYQTPFGYFLDLYIKAPGFSLARVFQDL